MNGKGLSGVFSMSEQHFVAKELFEKVLLAPCLGGADTLRIVSGYASAAMVAEHILRLREIGRPVKIDLIYGMAGADGVSKANHEGFLSLQDKREFFYEGSFMCAYVRKPLAIHTKLYVWCRGGESVSAFAGSANYTVNGFLGGTNRQELLVSCNPRNALAYWEDTAHKSVPCHGVDVRKEFAARPIAPVRAPTSTILLETDPNSPFKGYAKVELPLLTRAGNLGNGSCLNWGVRPNNAPRDDGNALRDPNQAYIRLEAKVYRTDFFPPIGHRFTVLTDDGHVFSCARAQANGKAIHTPQDNAELGRYFRLRLGVPLGAYIPPQALARYGRETVTFYKLDAENYVMDFSVPRPH